MPSVVVCYAFAGPAREDEESPGGCSLGPRLVEVLEEQGIQDMKKVSDFFFEKNIEKPVIFII